MKNSVTQKINQKIGIIGHGDNKFTTVTRILANELIYNILITKKPCILISGRSPEGGIDIYAETLAMKLNIPVDIKAPKTFSWNGDYGYKERNLDIAKTSDEIHVIVVKSYPINYNGMRFNYCYHCNTNTHVKSGACWTAKKAQELYKKAYWHVINGDKLI